MWPSLTLSVLHNLNLFHELNFKVSVPYYVPHKKLNVEHSPYGCTLTSVLANFYSTTTLLKVFKGDSESQHIENQAEIFYKLYL